MSKEKTSGMIGVLAEPRSTKIQDNGGECACCQK